jgi:hypothetical protein
MHSYHIVAELRQIRGAFFGQNVDPQRYGNAIQDEA